MNKPTTNSILTPLRWVASFLVLLFLVIHLIPRALGEREGGNRYSDVKTPLLKRHEIQQQQSVSSAPLDPNGCSLWTPTGSLNTARDSHTATLLPNGMVLVAGGFGPVRASAELYDPVSGTWTPTGSLNTARAQHTATLLPNGMVLVAGGFDSNVNPSASAELYDPASGTWMPTGSLNTARTTHTATLLPNGMVLVAGGFGASGDLPNAELYDPATGTWTPTGSLNVARTFHTATLLNNGMVLVAGDPALAALSPARNCTIRRPEVGLSRAASTSRAKSTRRPCCPMAWCWSQAVDPAALLRPRNCTIRRAGRGCSAAI
jgi:hypothetical protein